MNEDVLTLARWLDRHKVPSLSRTLTWYLNGPRGHYHGSKMCVKYKPTRASTVQATFAEADEHTICVQCAERAFAAGEGYGLVQSARPLFSAETALRDHKKFVAGLAPGADLERQQVRLAVQRLVNVLEHQVEHADLFALRDQMMSELRSFSDSIEIDKENLHRRICQTSAFMVFQAKLRGSSGVAEWCCENEYALLGEPGGRYQASHLSVLYDKFVEAVSQCGDVSVAAETVDVSAAFVAPNSLDLLRGCRLDLVTANANDQNVHDYAVRAWREQSSVAARAVMRRWASLINESASSPEWFLVVSRSDMYERSVLGHSYFDPSQAAMLSAQRWFRTRDRSAVLCAAPISEWMLGQRSYSSFELRVAVDADITAETIDTALALWEPYDRSSQYADFSVALDAAGLL